MQQASRNVFKKINKRINKILLMVKKMLQEKKKCSE